MGGWQIPSPANLKPSILLEAFRDLSYPLGVGSFDAYAIPRRGWVTGILRDGDRLELTADIETVIKFGRGYRLERQPMQSIAPDVLQRAAPECRYVVFDGDGQAVFAGALRPGEERRFVVDISGRYILAAEIAVGANVMNAEIRRYEFGVP